MAHLHAHLYAQGLHAAQGRGTELHEVRHRLLLAQASPYDACDAEDVMSRIAVLQTLLREFLTASQSVEIILRKLGWDERSEVITQDKRVTRDRVRDELFYLKIAASELMGFVMPNTNTLFKSTLPPSGPPF